MTNQGSGNIGSYLTSALLDAGFQVSILTRTTSKAPSAVEEARVIHSDYTLESLTHVFQGQDAIVNTVPVVHFEDQQQIIDAAIAAKVKRFLPNEFGVDNSAEGVGEVATAYFKVKREVVAYLRQKQAEGLSWTALCTGSWVDWVRIFLGIPPHTQICFFRMYGMGLTLLKSLSEGQGLLGFDIGSRTGLLLDNGNHKFIGTTVEKVGEATASVLLHSEKTANQYVHVSSFTLTQRLVLETLERISNSEFRMETMSVEELFAIAKKHQEEGDADGAYHRLVTAFVCSGNKAVYFPEKAAHWNNVLGLKQRETLDEMMRRLLVS